MYLRLNEINPHLRMFYTLSHPETTCSLDRLTDIVEIEWVCIGCRIEYICQLPKKALLTYVEGQKKIECLSDDEFLNLATGLCRDCFDTMIGKVNYVKN